MKERLLLLVMGICLLVLFGVRVGLILEGEKAHKVEPHKDTEVSGVVVDDPETREKSVHATIKLEGGGKVLAILPKDTEVFYNDRVTLKGDITEPQSFETNTGRIFDYAEYLRVKGISAEMRNGKVIKIESGKTTIYGSLFALKHAFEKSLEKVLPRPQSDLFEGILLGERRGLPDTLTQAFIVASLIHIVVLSGANIAIIGNAVLRSLTFLPRRWSFVVGAVLMILFVLMTGVSSTSVRACIMALIGILGRYLHRPTLALRSLGIAGAALLFWNPLVLFDVSFILSVLATFGLITLSTSVGEKFSFLRRYPKIHEIASTTIAVEIFILPALLYFMGILSFVSLPANILVLPIVPWTMLLGFITGLLSMLHIPLSIVTGLATDILLRYMIFVAHTAASLPFSSLTIPAFPVWVILIVYAPLSWLAIFVYRRTAAQRQTN